MLTADVLCATAQLALPCQALFLASGEHSSVQEVRRTRRCETAAGRRVGRALDRGLRHWHCVGIMRACNAMYGCVEPGRSECTGNKQAAAGGSGAPGRPHSIISPCDGCCCGCWAAPNTKAPWAGAAPKLSAGGAAALNAGPPAGAPPPNAPQPPPKAGQPKGPTPGCCCPCIAAAGCWPTGTWKWLALGPSSCRAGGAQRAAASRCLKANRAAFARSCGGQGQAGRPPAPPPPAAAPRRLR